MIQSFLADPDEGVSALPHLSHSRVNRYLLCPEQYRLYYVEGLRPRLPPSSLVFGNIVHQALAHCFMKGGDPVTHFEEMWAIVKEIRLGYKERESWEKLRASGMTLLSKFVAEEMPKLGTVTAAEKPFEFAVTTINYPFVGVIDLIAELQGGKTVVDFKTAGASYDSHEAAMSDQLTAYKLAEPQVLNLALCVLVKTKEPKIEWYVSQRNGEQLAEYLTKVGHIAQEISTARFYKRTGMWCSWCDFLPVCLGNRKEAAETLIQAP